MSRHEKDLERLLDRALEEIRRDAPSDEDVEAAGARVWARIESSTAAPKGCADYRRMIPDYLEGRLPDARRLLLEDHSRECIPCRKALKQAPQRSATPVAAATPTGGGLLRRRWVWGAAAAVLLVAVVGLGFINGTTPFGVQRPATVSVASLEGGLLHVVGNEGRPLSQGQSVTLARGESVRTTRESYAVLELADGSQIEMRERSEVGVGAVKSLLRAKADATIHLRRGNIIVGASDQGSGHLFVDTDDCDIAVTGTVFAVNHGTLGSRVSVIEGEVRVDHDRGKTILHAGDQVNTDPSVEAVPVEQEIAWSPRFEQHLALLREFRKLGREIDAAIAAPGLRYDTELLERTSPDAVLYAAIPNMGQQLSQAYDMFRDRVAANQLLNDWWQENVAGGEVEEHMAWTIGQMRDLSEQLGEEIAITLSLPAGETEPRGPMVMARLTDPASFRDFLAVKLDEIEATAGMRPPIRFLDDPTAGDEGEGLYLVIRDGLLFASPERLALLESAERPVRGSAFRGRLAQAYREGVEWLIGVDLQRMVATGIAASGEEPEDLERAGVLDFQHVIAQSREDDDGTQRNEVVLTFDQERKGIASWIGEPAAMGSLDFISGEASLATAVMLKEPVQILDELFAMIDDESLQQELALFEEQHGISVRDDFAALLGGEFAAALDGPMLPTPSWKVIVEVYDPVRMEQTIGWVVKTINEIDGGSAEPTMRRLSETVGGREYHELRLASVDFGIHYTYEDGYLLAAPSRAMIDRALSFRDAGFTLIDSPEVRKRLPRDDRVNFSMIAYQHVAPMLGPLFDQMRRLSRELPEEQRMMIEALGRDQEPTLALGYAERDRITIMATSEGGPFAMGLGSIFSNLSGMALLAELGQEAEVAPSQP